ncbi:hypothetical protein [Haloprofundus sp. MHR1]|uniref:DUF7534 family protein n=1 Tax=Haloprofundus sp. MHR1 TaxID=2572921 RepID=UPI0010BE3B03|nr:hypothetical protein [Haloprofundus sp. MHR1]QCJ47156.1 hypothetical protein FCF25_08530 [Haloprofundus sp. MHR1]
MARRRFWAFLLTMLALDAVMLVAIPFVVPPDPTARLMVFAAVLATIPALAFWLAYRGGFERLGVWSPEVESEDSADGE